MPSNRQQFNIRLSDETRDLLIRLIPAVATALGMEVSQADLVRLGLNELRKKYLPACLPRQACLPKIKRGKRTGQ